MTSFAHRTCRVDLIETSTYTLAAAMKRGGAPRGVGGGTTAQ
jgi:hypothetical protein